MVVLLHSVIQYLNYNIPRILPFKGIFTLTHSSGVLSGSHSLDHVGSQSDLTSHVETQSHDPLSESHDPPTESQDLFSEVGNLEDLPFG